MFSVDEKSAHAASPDLSARSRIAFFGGSFDPPHNGHLAIARAALETLHLDSVLFAPVARQPLKSEVPTDFDHRAAMTALAIADEPRFALSLLDAPRTDGQPNFTVDALLRLRAQFSSNTQVFFLLGADALLQFARWHRAAEIPFLATLIVASRPGAGNAANPHLWLPASLRALSVANNAKPLSKLRVEDAQNQTAEIYFLEGLHFDISASDLRVRLSAARSVRNESALHTLLPVPVQNYIREHHLYRSST
jgi:nicotinate-nucleotide adenylyltransferase